MKFTATTTPSQSGYALACEPDGLTDGHPPIASLELDTIVQNLSASRLAVAGCIAFDSFIGQEVLLEEPIHRMAQAAIGKFFGSRDVVSGPVTDVPVSVWPSSGVLAMRSFGDGAGLPSLESEHRFVVEIADGANFNGAISSAHRMIVAANAEFMSRIPGTRVSRPELYVAIAVLLSQDLHLRTIHVALDGDQEAWAFRCRALLRSVELNLVWSS